MFKERADKDNVKENIKQEVGGFFNRLRNGEEKLHKGKNSKQSSYLGKM